MGETQNQSPARDRNPNGPYGSSNGVQALSSATCKLSLFRNEIPLSTASGFLMENSKSWLLVTALHNFTGRDYFTKKCLSPQLAVPNRFGASIRIEELDGLLHMYKLSGDLFNSGTPLFLFDCSSEGGDVAVISIPKAPDQPKLATMNRAASRNWTVFAGLDVFVLGHPDSLDASGTPIWKRVSIASEPSQRVNGTDITLTDGLTYKGMSGGPVIINQSQGFCDEKSYIIDKELLARVIGVYGGRLDIDSDRSGTLGFYWPIEIVNRIILKGLQVGDIDCE